MECVALKYVLGFESKGSTSAESLEVQYFLQMKAKSIAVPSMVTRAKRLWSACRCDLTLGSHTTGFVCLGWMFSFFIFYFTICKTGSSQG